MIERSGPYTGDFEGNLSVNGRPEKFHVYLAYKLSRAGTAGTSTTEQANELQILHLS